MVYQESSVDDSKTSLIAFTVLETLIQQSLSLRHLPSIFSFISENLFHKLSKRHLRLFTPHSESRLYPGFTDNARDERAPQNNM